MEILGREIIQDPLRVQSLTPTSFEVASSKAKTGKPIESGLIVSKI